MKKFKVIVIAIIILFTHYPAVELTRCIIKYNSWKTDLFTINNGAEIWLIWGGYLLALIVIWEAMTYLIKRYGK